MRARGAFVRATLIGAMATMAAGFAGSRAAAADLVVPAPNAAMELPAGVPCDNPVVQAFPSVWLGHFTGGYSHYVGAGGPIVLDWRDEKLCFPDRRTCDGYIREMRRDFHRPEGYFTCLPIR